MLYRNASPSAPTTEVYALGWYNYTVMMIIELFTVLERRLSDVVVCLIPDERARYYGGAGRGRSGPVPSEIIIMTSRLTVYYAKFWGRRCRVVTVRRYQRRLPLYSGSVSGAHSASH